MAINKKTIKKIGLSALVLIILNVGLAFAATAPTTINYSGYLTNSSGRPITASKDIKVAIYEAETGGSAGYVEMHSSVAVVQGEFSFLVGSGTVSTGNWTSNPDFTKALWMELTVDPNGTPETLSPRIPLMPAPYARMALDLTDGIVTENKLAASLAFDDGDLLDLSGITADSTTEGIKLPIYNSTATAEGQITWDTTNDKLYVGDGTSAQEIGASSGGVGSSVDSSEIEDDTIVDADINSGAAIADSKLATISTSGKVSNSATTATNANTASTIVARDGSGNFSAGTITANLTGTINTASQPSITSVGTLSGLTVSGTTGLQGATTFGSVGNTYVFPTSRGGNGQVLKSDASGNVTWQSDSTGTLGSSVDSSEIDNDTIAEVDIANDAISLAKMDSGTAGNLITYDASGNPAAVATGTATQVLTSNGAGAAPTFQNPSTNIANDAVTLAKMAPGTDGNLITYDASGDPAAVATGNAGQVLTSNGAGAAPTFQAAGGGGGGVKHVITGAQTRAFDADDSFNGRLYSGDSGGGPNFWGYSTLWPVTCTASGLQLKVRNNSATTWTGGTMSVTLMVDGSPVSFTVSHDGSSENLANGVTGTLQTSSDTYNITAGDVLSIIATAASVTAGASLNVYYGFVCTE